MTTGSPCAWAFVPSDMPPIDTKSTQNKAEMRFIKNRELIFLFAFPMRHLIKPKKVCQEPVQLAIILLAS